MRKIIIGSRGSDLALWQARYTQAELKKLGHDAEITIIKTQGDKIQHLSFDKLEGKGFFTKEIEERLLDGSIDVAVHSHKDLPTENPKGLTVAAVSYREDPADIGIPHRGGGRLRGHTVTSSPVIFRPLRMGVRTCFLSNFFPTVNAIGTPIVPATIGTQLA